MCSLYHYIIVKFYIMIKVDIVSVSFVLSGKSEHQEKLDAALKVRITFKMEKYS